MPFGLKNEIRINKIYYRPCKILHVVGKMRNSETKDDVALERVFKKGARDHH